MANDTYGIWSWPAWPGDVCATTLGAHHYSGEQHLKFTNLWARVTLGSCLPLRPFRPAPRELNLISDTTCGSLAELFRMHWRKNTMRKHARNLLLLCSPLRALISSLAHGSTFSIKGGTRHTWFAHTLQIKAVSRHAKRHANPSQSHQALPNRLSMPKFVIYGKYLTP